MTKNDFNFDTPRCGHTNCNNMAVDLHELMGGRSAKKGTGIRDLCIKYHIQLPLCREHHNWYEANKKASFIIGCEIIGLIASSTNYAINMNEVELLESIKEQCIKFYKFRYGIDL